jgi:hypothetical protein
MIDERDRALFGLGGRHESHIASIALAALMVWCRDRAKIRDRAAREVLLRVRATSLNYRDLMVLHSLL